MSQPNSSGSSPNPPSLRRGTPWILTAIGGVAMLILLVGLAVWLSGRDDEITTSSTPATTTLAPATTTLPASIPATTAPEVTTIPTTVPATTVPSTTVPVSTTAPQPPPTTAPAGPSGDSWSITSQYFPDHPFMLDRVAQVDRLSAYDGAIDVAPAGMRCVAIVSDGEGWSEWCAEPAQAANFVVLDGIDPWIVEVGADPGDVTLNRRDPSWIVPTNGCTVSMTTLIAAARVAPAVTTGIVCVPGEAFLSHSAVFLQPGPPDGGGILVNEGDEGWDSISRGTALDCDDLGDGVDRCALYGVEFDLFQAVRPVPPNAQLTAATDVVGMRNETATALSWIGAAEIGPAAVDALIVDELTDPEAELAPTVSRASGVGYEQLNLLIVEVPAFDDSILSITWAFWISASSPSTVVHAYAWETCARGLAGPDLCI